MDTTKKIDSQSTVTNANEPTIQIPGYKILRELGHGGMATVYLAIQESFGREVALKILSPLLADDDQFSKRFLREVRIVSQLNHPNIVTVYDAGKHGKHNYMSMEYIPGKELRQLKDSLSRKETLRIVKDVAGALDYAGKKGIVHRDVKPENIMIHQSDNRVILMDFGIAHGSDVTQGMTQTGKAIGTPHFMSPEQTKGLKVDHRSDIYSLGVVLYQLLAGHLPFDADSAVAVGIKHLTAPIPLLPGGLEIFQPIINHCLSKQPQHRYQKAAEIVVALEKITDEQLESINTKATVFKKAGADRNAETQISEAVVNQKRKIPDLVFPSKNKGTGENAAIDPTKKSSRSRNLLLILLISLMVYAGRERQSELNEFWGNLVLPEIVKIFPDLLPQAYVESWSKKSKVEIISTDQKPLDSTTDITVDTEADKTLTNVQLENQLKTPLTESSIGAEKVPSKDPISLLKDSLISNPKNALKLVVIYRDMLAQSPHDLIARKGLKELREWSKQQIRLAFANEDAVIARLHIDLIKQSFPKVAKNKRFIRLEKKVALLEKINLHFTQAEKYFKAGALSKPLNNNALAEIQNVFRLSPKNEDAKEFIKKIVASYLTKTNQLVKQGNIHNAILMVEEGIAALNNNQLLVDKRTGLKEEIKRQKNILSLFKQAEKYKISGQLIKPRAYNAYDLYQKILHHDKDNLRAKAELKNIHQLLSKKIIQLVHNGDFEKSNKYLQAAIQRYGKSSILANAQLKLNDALDELAPKIEIIKLSNSTVTNLITNNLILNNIETLTLHKTLYVGFNFINFDPTTTWLNVTLFNKTQGIKVVQKPVVISKQSGEHFFDLSLTTTGFKNNEYRLEIKIKNKILISKSFLVKN